MKPKILLIISSLGFIFFKSAFLIANNPVNENISITSPPKELNFDPFYKKYVDANGFPIISSNKVPDEALLKAKEIIVYMTSVLPDDVVAKMKEIGVRVGVMARYEGTTDIPEHKFLENDTSLNWDVRARGLGGSEELPLTTCAEENLLCYQIDKYHAEDILIHEFAHTIHLIGIKLTNPDIDKWLQDALDKAIKEGKWENTYAATNIEEYWAEGVQSWFNVNAQVPEPDGKHNLVNTREELKEYDPGLYEILKKYFPEDTKKISCHCSL